MADLSYALRSKPSWWRKFKDPIVRAKWREEALQHEIRGGRLSEKEVEWILDEVEDYEKMRNEETAVQVGLCFHSRLSRKRDPHPDLGMPLQQPSCFVQVYESDKLIPEKLKFDLISAAAVFENVPEAEKDWHPRSDNMVLDLVHPSLFCTVYGRTLVWTTDPQGKRKLEHLQRPKHDLDSWSYSDKFAWIPTDFQLGQNGEPAKALDYINNVHPEHNKDLVPVIEALVGRFSLLWDRVLTDLFPTNQGMLPGRQRVKGMYEWVEAEGSAPKPEWSQYHALGAEAWNAAYNAWEETRILVPPTVDERGIDIKVQVIVKLANIHLGKWHVEGMANERIVASGIYYYDCENITESQLGFRQAESFVEAEYEQGDGRAISQVWGMEQEQESNQFLGAVQTSVNRCIAFPNIYQHQVSSFKLVDPTKPGHRKIVALFLVDPNTRIPSTTDIAPQQGQWVHEAVRDSLHNEKKPMAVPLPVELIDMVSDNVESAMTLKGAKQYREQLMDERTAFVGVVDEQHFMTEFNFCEH
ncbi:hypothetical protein FRB90_004583 [Tulasnella sp. 427]|nr:hypothetical protein FRB90_004583 [Tulasnella sp. 427]